MKPSRLLFCAAALMTLSALLTALCVSLIAGGVLLAAALCMGTAAWHFYQNETNDQEQTEE